MKKQLVSLLSVLLLSCQTLPAIDPAGKAMFACPFPFPGERSRWVHSIESRMPGDQRSSAIGVTVINPATQAISCAVMTAEGMVLFEAEDGPGGLQVKRALPPFDSGEVAKNLIADIRLIFLAPRGLLEDKGFLSNGAAACRYRDETGGWIDVIGEDQSEDVQIRRYSSSGTLKRQVRFSHKSKNFYQRVELQADEIYPYSLEMELLETRTLKKNPKH
ncbi:MAG TPA: hypothetical protein PLT45_08935 [Smithella sp.]|nr:hypothetical protein [Smithella sp.]